jgi:hypothetical protein
MFKESARAKQEIMTSMVYIIVSWKVSLAHRIGRIPLLATNWSTFREIPSSRAITGRSIVLKSKLLD